MDEHRIGEGGAANTPPFPRPDIVHKEEEPASEPAQDSSAAGSEPATPPEDVPQAPNRAEAGVPAPDDLDSAERIGDAGEPEAPIDSSADGDFEDMDDTDPYTERERLDEDLRFANRAREEFRRRAGSGFSRGLDEIAARLEEASERIERIADEQLRGPGPRGRAGQVAQTTAGRLTEVSDYLRASDLDNMRSDLERQVQEHPLRSVLIAVGTGLILGRIIR